MERERESAKNMLAMGSTQDRLIKGEGIFPEQMTAWQSSLKEVGSRVLGNHREIQHTGTEAQILGTGLPGFEPWLCHPQAV